MEIILIKLDEKQKTHTVAILQFTKLHLIRKTADEDGVRNKKQNRSHTTTAK